MTKSYAQPYFLCLTNRKLMKPGHLHSIPNIYIENDPLALTNNSFKSAHSKWIYELFDSIVVPRNLNLFRNGKCFPSNCDILIENSFENCELCSEQWNERNCLNRKEWNGSEVIKLSLNFGLDYCFCSPLSCFFFVGFVLFVWNFIPFSHANQTTEQPNYNNRFNTNTIIISMVITAGFFYDDAQWWWLSVEIYVCCVGWEVDEQWLYSFQSTTIDKLKWKFNSKNSFCVWHWKWL